MILKPKLWIGVGLFATAGAPAAGIAAPAITLPDRGPAAPADGLNNQPTVGTVRVAQGRHAGGERGEGGERGAPSRPDALVKHQSKPKIHRTLPSHPASDGEGGERGASRPYVLDGARTRNAARGAYPIVGAGGEGGERGKAGVNTRYIFGFTDGADVEPQGEIEIESDNIIRFSKQAGNYRGLEGKIEFEYGVTDNLLFEFAGIHSYNRIRGVPGLDDHDAANFDGFSTELKYLILDRRIYPFGVGVSIEPEWTRFDGTSGRHEDGYHLETKLFIEKELIPGVFFAAVNLTYEPELVHVDEFDAASGRFVNFARESALGVSGAITYAVAPGAFLGGELRYLTQFSGVGLNRFAGDALFLGPTLSVRFLSVAPNVLLQAAYSVQVAGSNVDDPAANLNLTDFERQQVRLRLVYEF